MTVIKDEESGNKGRGFLVHGGYVLTAAHCVPWSGEGEMPLGDRFFVTIIAADGSRLKGQVVGVEPVSDIAVIASPDGQDLPKDAEAFDRFVDSTEGLILCRDEFPFGEGFPVLIFTHKGEWISGEPAQWRKTLRLYLLKPNRQSGAGLPAVPLSTIAGKWLALFPTPPNPQATLETMARMTGLAPGHVKAWPVPRGSSWVSTTRTLAAWSQ